MNSTKVTSIMRMTSSIASLLILMAAPLHSAASKATSEKLMTMRIDGEIEVSQTGLVESHRIKTDVTDDIRKLVDRAIADWRFEPPTMDNGAPARARGQMRITLAALPTDGGNYAVRVDNVVFPASPSRGRIYATTKPTAKAPSFPVNAIVPVEFRISPTGETLDVTATQCSILAMAPGSNEGRVCAQLVQSAERGLRRLRFKFDDVPPAPVSGVLPLHFLSYGADALDENMGVWRAEWRTRYTKPVWAPDDAPRVGASDLTGGAFMQHAPGLRLREGAIGRVL